METPNADCRALTLPLNPQTQDHGTLCRHDNNEAIRLATKEELAESVEAAAAGVFGWFDGQTWVDAYVSF